MGHEIRRLVRVLKVSIREDGFAHPYPEMSRSEVD